MTRVGISKCNVPDYCTKKTQTAADKINKRIDELNALGADYPAKRDALLADALSGSVTGEDFIRRRRDLREDDLHLQIDCDTVPLYQQKLELVDDIAAAGRKESERLQALADERERMLAEKLKDFDGRPADRTALIRSDRTRNDLKSAANAARSFSNNFVRPEDQAWRKGFEMRLRVQLGLPAVPEERAATTRSIFKQQ